jgi:hypothetical protein
MVDWFHKHWRGFWDSGPENTYSFLWYALLTAAVTAVLYVGTLLLAKMSAVGSEIRVLAPKWEERFLSAFVALLVVVILTVVDRRIKNRQPALQGKPTQPIVPEEPVVARKEVSPETLDALRATAAVLQSRPVEADIQPETPAAPEAVGETPWEKEGYIPTVEDLEVVYAVDKSRRIVKLKFLSDRSSRDEDCLFLLLYGYKTLLDQTDVPVAKLDESLFESGCRPHLNLLESISNPFGTNPRLKIPQLAERAISNQLMQKSGLSKGGFYKLTESGLRLGRFLFIYMRDYA